MLITLFKRRECVMDNIKIHAVRMASQTPQGLIRHAAAAPPFYYSIRPPHAKKRPWKEPVFVNRKFKVHVLLHRVLSNKLYSSTPSDIHDQFVIQQPSGISFFCVCKQRNRASGLIWASNSETQERKPRTSWPDRSDVYLNPKPITPNPN